jgi:hypothetical protein
MTSTTMYRKVRCTICEYTQVDTVSYYKHAKDWKANHDLKMCLAIRRNKKDYISELLEQTLMADYEEATKEGETK